MFLGRPSEQPTQQKGDCHIDGGRIGAPERNLFSYPAHILLLTKFNHFFPFLPSPGEASAVRYTRSFWLDSLTFKVARVMLQLLSLRSELTEIIKQLSLSEQARSLLKGHLEGKGHSPYFTDENMETQESPAICPRLFSWKAHLKYLI